MNKKVAIITGSASDLNIAEKCIEVLKRLGLEFEINIISAHRTPESAREFAINARKNNFGVIIAIAGKAAHLAGVLAAHTRVPVIENGVITGKRQKAFHTLNEAEEYVVSIYQMIEEDPTIREIYTIVQDDKLNNDEIMPSTYTRNWGDFNRFFEEFGQRRISTVEEYVDEVRVLCRKYGSLLSEYLAL